MTTAELITKLQALDPDGTLPVHTWDDWYDFELEYVTIEPAEDEVASSDVLWRPRRIVLGQSGEH